MRSPSSSFLALFAVAALGLRGDTATGSSIIKASTCGSSLIAPRLRLRSLARRDRAPARTLQLRGGAATAERASGSQRGRPSRFNDSASSEGRESLALWEDQGGEEFYVLAPDDDDDCEPDEHDIPSGMMLPYRISDEGHNGLITCLTYGHERVYTGSVDGTTRVWDAASGACLKVLRHSGEGEETPSGFVTSVAVTDSAVWVGMSNGALHIWSLASFEWLGQVGGHWLPENLNGGNLTDFIAAGGDEHQFHHGSVDALLHFAPSDTRVASRSDSGGKAEGGGADVLGEERHKSFVVSGCLDGMLRVWEEHEFDVANRSLAMGKACAERTAPERRAAGQGSSPWRRSPVVGPSIATWRAKLAGHQDSVLGLAHFRGHAGEGGARGFLSCSRDGTIRVWRGALCVMVVGSDLVDQFVCVCGWAWVWVGACVQTPRTQFVMLVGSGLILLRVQAAQPPTLEPPNRSRGLPRPLPVFSVREAGQGLVVSGSARGSICVWDSRDWSLVSRVHAHTYTKCNALNESFTFEPPVFGLWAGTPEAADLARHLAVSVGGDGVLAVWRLPDAMGGAGRGGASRQRDVARHVGCGEGTCEEKGASADEGLPMECVGVGFTGHNADIWAVCGEERVDGSLRLWSGGACGRLRTWLMPALSDSPDSS